MVENLEQAAQRAGEQRLAHANDLLYAEELEPPEPTEEIAAEGLAGPYCGCDTCIVREVLDAAWPYLLEAARLEADNEKRPPHHARAVHWGGPTG